MNKVLSKIKLVILILFAFSLSGCTLVEGKEQTYFYERPAIGFTVEDEVITNIDLQKRTSLSFKSGDGIISIEPYGGDTLQIVEKRKLTGPSFKKALKSMLEGNNIIIEKDAAEVRLDCSPSVKLKPLFRMTDDIEIKVPGKLLSIDISENSGSIYVKDIKDVNSINIDISKGNIEVAGCEANKLYTSIEKGNLDVSSFYGNGSYKCNRGNICLLDNTGNIELESISGDTVIEKSKGILKCSISTGTLKISDCRIISNTELYASFGSIMADLSNIDSEGKYSIKASEGDIKLKLSDKSGWSLIAKSTKGKISNNLKLPGQELKKLPTGELYGDVLGGGPFIDTYVDMGNIVLN